MAYNDEAKKDDVKRESRRSSDGNEGSFLRGDYELSSVYDDSDNPIERLVMNMKPYKSAEQKHSWRVDGVQVKFSPY